MDKVSIVVPVYNTNEEMFKKCILSLVGQTYKCVEIILVDDGSNSGIEKICDMYQNRYTAIRVIHKDNGGLASARNAGQAVATGKWLVFIDSDDWIEQNTIELLVKTAQKNNNPELIVFGYVQHFCEKNVYCKFTYDDTVIMRNNNYELVEEALNFPSLFSSSCWKMFNVSFLNENQLRHDEDVRQGSEDLEFMIRVLTKVRIAIVLHERLYHYLMNSESITNSFNEKNAYSVQTCFIAIEKSVSKLNNIKLLELFYLRSWYALCASLVSGYMNPNNGLKYPMKKKLAKAFMSTEFAKKIINKVDVRKIGFSRKIVYLCVKYGIYFPIYYIAVLRGKQKRR